MELGKSRFSPIKAFLHRPQQWDWHFFASLLISIIGKTNQCCWLVEAVFWLFLRPMTRVEVVSGWTIHTPAGAWVGS